MTTIKTSEVLSHNTKDDCWIIINNSIYNVTDFLKEHPGGGDVILDFAGKDATEAFADIGHSKDAIEMLPDYLIGTLPEDEIKKQSDKKDGCAIQ